MTDEQFVEKVRRDLGRSKTIAIWLSFILVGAFIAAIWLTDHFIQTVQNIGNEQGDVDRGLILGLFAGISISFMFYSLAHSAFQSIMIATGRGYPIRTMRLLIKYHDKEHQAEQGAAANP